MRGGLLRGKPPLLFLRSGILAGQGSFLYAESRNKQNWRDIDIGNFSLNTSPDALCFFGYSHIMYHVEYYPCGGAV